MAQPVRKAVLMFLLPGVLGGADLQRHDLRLGGRVEMRLEAGEYEILPGDGEQLSVALSGPDADRVRVRLDGTDRDLRLSVRRPNHCRFRAVIRVPASCDLQVRHSAGELKIGAVRGHKDIRLRAGSLDLQVGDPAEYARVEATVTAGDLDARPFRVAKGGLFRTFRWEGGGRYDLRARITAGELVFR